MFSSRKTAAPSGGYSIGQSLRFRSSASAYLNRTFGTGTSTQKGTLSVWIKRGVLGNGSNYNYIFDGGAWQASAEAPLVLNTTDNLTFYNWNGSAIDWQVTTSAVLRDPSAWYHIIASWDSTQATAANRVILYINGVQQTALQTASYPSQNANLRFNDAIAHAIGRWQYGAARYFDGYMAEFNFVDGQQLTPSSFGAYDTNGVWQPIKYSGSYGTNGFYLPFSNTTSTTTLGYDSSGNGNNWTTNNISLTSGTTYDSMTDSPTVSSTSVANYPVWNPITGSNGAIATTNGNLFASVPTGSTNGYSTATTMAFPKTGKWYFEATWYSSGSPSFAPGIGISSDQAGALGSAYLYDIDGTKSINGSTSAYGSSYTNGDIIGVAFDAGAGTLTFYKNNTSQGTAATGLTSTYWAAARIVQQSSYASGSYINFGQQPFTYTPPTGFNALNTYNLPAATINNGALYMAATTYTGTGSSNSISNGNNNTIGTTFQPDFVWIKSRSAATDHKLTDSVRGTTKALVSDSTAAETTDSNGLTAFNSGGFTVGSDSTYNNNAATYVGWNWKAGGSGGSSNTNGSITSTVSVNQTAGFSVVTWTGTGSNATIGHGLGVAPSMLINKFRNTTSDWPVYHTSIGAGNVIYLNTTAASASSPASWNNTAPTSSVFSVGGAAAPNGTTMVTYCFASVAGYSAFGSYTGNGSSDGPFVYLGFRPRWVMFRRTDSTQNWLIFDTSRDTYNPEVTALFANVNNADTNGYNVDYLSNGFKPRDGLGGYNASGGTYIYAAFAENPFNYSRAR